MKKTLFILIAVCAFAIQVSAQYVRVNYDKNTIAATVRAYGAESAAEVYTNALVRTTQVNYSFPQLSAAGILPSKSLVSHGMTSTARP